MDLTKKVEYRGLNINDMAVQTPGTPLSGYKVKRMRYADVQGEGYREKRSLADGYDAGNVFLGFRPIAIQGEAYGVDKGDLWDRVQRLKATFSPTLAYASAGAGTGIPDPSDLGFLDLLCYQPTNHFADWPVNLYPDGIPLVFRARPQSQPGFLVEDAHTGGGVSEYGLMLPFDLTLWAKDPRIYVQSPTEIGLSGSGGTGDQPPLVNRGDYPCPLDILLYVTATTEVKFTFNGCGSVTEATVPADTNPRYLRLDSTNKVCTYQVGNLETLRMDLIQHTGGTTWPVVSPSPASQNKWSWKTTGGNLHVDSKLFYNEAFA